MERGDVNQFNRNIEQIKTGIRTILNNFRTNSLALCTQPRLQWQARFYVEHAFNVLFFSKRNGKRARSAHVIRYKGINNFKHLTVEIVICCPLRVSLPKIQTLADNGMYSQAATNFRYKKTF